MGSRLDNIIRLRQWELDEQRREFAALLGKKDELLHQLDMLGAEINEQATSTALEVYSTTVGAYMAGARLKRDYIEADIAKLDKQIDEMQEQVSEKFRELKTFEIARDQEMRREKLAEAREEQQMFDDLAIQNHTRQDAVLDSMTLNRRES